MTIELRECLKGWRPIVRLMKSVPTSVHQLGGVWTAGSKGINPVVWQVQWPNEVVAAFEVGILTINDLELAGIVLNWFTIAVLESDLKYQHLATFL